MNGGQLLEECYILGGLGDVFGSDAVMRVVLPGLDEIVRIDQICLTRRFPPPRS